VDGAPVGLGRVLCGERKGQKGAKKQRSQFH
jgi:hypothetical protein